MNDAAASEARPSFGAVLFSFQGRIDRGRYWLGLLVALGIFVLGAMFAASAMSPTGGGAPLLAIPAMLVFIWIYPAVTMKRLRDAGWPFILQVIYPALFPGWIFGMMEYVEAAPLLYGGVPPVLLAIPGIIKGRSAEN